MSYCPPLKGAPRAACLALATLGGKATAGQVSLAAGIARTAGNKAMRRLIAVGCVQIFGQGKPMVFELTQNWRERIDGWGGRVEGEDDEGDLDTDRLFAQSKRERPRIRTDYPKAPWAELQAMWLAPVLVADEDTTQLRIVQAMEIQA